MRIRDPQRASKIAAVSLSIRPFGRMTSSPSDTSCASSMVISSVTLAHPPFMIAKRR